MIGSEKPRAVYANRMQRYPDAAWLIWSNKWGCWYRANSQGYTRDILQAGIYTREQAASRYPGPVPRKFRDVEPFPISSVRSSIQRRAEQVRAEFAAQETRVAALLSHIDGVSVQ